MFFLRFNTVLQTSVQTLSRKDGREHGRLTQEQAAHVIEFILALPAGTELRRLFIRHIITEQGVFRHNFRFKPKGWDSSDDLVVFAENDESELSAGEDAQDDVPNNEQVSLQVPLIPISTSLDGRHFITGGKAPPPMKSLPKPA